jgi:hypothetical protein
MALWSLRNGRAAKTLVFVRFAFDSAPVVGKNFLEERFSVGKFFRLILRSSGVSGAPALLSADARSGERAPAFRTEARLAVDARVAR